MTKRDAMRQKISEMFSECFLASITRPHFGREDEVITVGVDYKFLPIEKVQYVWDTFCSNPLFTKLPSRFGESIGVTDGDVDFITDAGVSIYELNLKPSKSIEVLNDNRVYALRILRDALNFADGKLLGMGHAPINRLGKNPELLWYPKKRYYFLRYCFPPEIHKITRTAAMQLHIETTFDDVVRHLNKSHISGVINAIFGNANILEGIVYKRQSFRGEIWGFSREASRYGNFDRFFSCTEEWIEHILNLQLVFFELNGEYTVVNDGRSCFQYLLSRSDLSNEDLFEIFKQHLCSSWNEARGTDKGTAEYRSACAEPFYMNSNLRPSPAFVFTAGIALSEDVEFFVKKYDVDFWRRVKQEGQIKGLRGKVRYNNRDVKIIDLAKDLLLMSFTEISKKYPTSLYHFNPVLEAVSLKKSPADIAYDLFKSEGIKPVLRRAVCSHLF